MKRKLTLFGKRSTMLLVAAIFFSTALFAQTLQVNPDEINFGEVMVGRYQFDQYQITGQNLTQRIMIGSMNPFFAVSLSQEGHFTRRLIIEPDDEGLVDKTVFVRFLPRRAALVESNIIHRSREIDERVTVRISGTAYSEPLGIELDPDRLDFGRVEIGHHETESYNITARDFEGTLIIGSNNPQLTLSDQEDGEFARRIRVIPDNGGVINQNVYVRFAPRIRGDLTAAIIHQLHQTNIQMLLPVAGTGYGGEEQQPITFDRELIDFGEVNVGLQTTESYQVTAPDAPGSMILVSNNHQITISAQEDGEFSRRMQLTPDEDGNITQTVYVRYAPNIARPVRAFVNHRFRENHMPVRLPVIGQGVGEGEPPAITFDPQLLDFEEVTVGRQAVDSYQVSVRNAPENMIVKTNNPQITISTEPEGEYVRRLQLAPDEDGAIIQTVYVRYAPRMARPLRTAINHRFHRNRLRVPLPVIGTGIGDDDPQGVVLNPQRIDFGEVETGHHSVEGYHISANDVRRRMMIISDNPHITISNEREGEFVRRLEIVPDAEGNINQRLFVRFSPLRPMNYRASISHRVRGVGEPVILPVLGTGIDNGRGDSLDVEEGVNLIAKTELLGNYPNPFNPETTIRFTLKNPSEVTLNVYNLQGQRIKTLVNKNLPAGIHSYLWDGTNNEGRKSPSGVYLYIFKAGSIKQTGNMMLLK